jgi:uncharacterized protein with GYD domain
MASYVMMCRYTDEGARKVKDSPDRMEAFKKAARNYGGEVKAAFLLLGGRYDTLVFFNAPDDEAAAKAACWLGAQGNVRTETHRAFSEEEFRRLTKDLGT